MACKASEAVEQRRPEAFLDTNHGQAVGRGTERPCILRASFDPCVCEKESGDAFPQSGQGSAIRGVEKEISERGDAGCAGRGLRTAHLMRKRDVGDVVQPDGKPHAPARHFPGSLTEPLGPAVLVQDHGRQRQPQESRKRREPCHVQARRVGIHERYGRAGRR